MAMHKNSLHLIIVVAALIVLTACSSRARILDIQDQEIVSRQALTVDQVEVSIIKAGKVRGWVMRVQKPGHIVARLSPRTHMVELDIFYDSDSYSIVYKDSAEMNYKKGKIHASYNKWVANLDRDIRGTLPP